MVAWAYLRQGGKWIGLRYPGERTQLINLHGCNVLFLDVSFRDDLRFFFVLDATSRLSVETVRSMSEAGVSSGCARDSSGAPCGLGPLTPSFSSASSRIGTATFYPLYLTYATLGRRTRIILWMWIPWKRGVVGAPYLRNLQPFGAFRPGSGTYPRVAKPESQPFGIRYLRSFS